MTTTLRSSTRRLPVSPGGAGTRGRLGPIVGVLLVAILTAGCAAGSPDDAAGETTASRSVGPDGGPSSAAPTAPATGPTLVVTVPDLDDAGSPPDAAGTPATASAASSRAPSAETVVTSPTAPAPTAPAPIAPAPIEPAPAPAGTDRAAPTTADPDPSAPAAAIDVQLANCESCTVLATHRDVVGGLSAALVSSPGGRALLLAVRADGVVAGVINVPYGASFPTPPGGVLPCNTQAHCGVQGVQSDGRALLSAFALTDTGAWRNISGDDAFPSVTDRAAVVDLDGQLGLAVQDQGTGEPIWLLYRWLGGRFAVAGCAADGDAPTSVGAVSPDSCLS